LTFQTYNKNKNSTKQDITETHWWQFCGI
jgi:hypothetical protein